MAQLFGDRMGAPHDRRHAETHRSGATRMTARPAVRQVVGAMAAYLVSQGRPIPDFLAQP